MTDIICESCKYLPTKRSRNKPKPAQIGIRRKTAFNYTAHLWDIRWQEESSTRKPNNGLF
ncbi:NinE family protein [Salmonella enterica subsp. enterica]|nr:NinE family protein [Salmonella enterica subsp. enterica]